MFSRKETKNEITSVISNPPSYEDMLADLRMHNVRVSHRSGDTSTAPSMDRTVVERVWKSYKINSILEKQFQSLRSKGIKATIIDHNMQNFLKEIESDINTTIERTMDSAPEDGYVEFEVFDTKHKVKN